ILIGLLAAVSDFLGAFGTGTGILLSVGIVDQYYQALVQEQITELYPGLRRLLGR
ncbi:preprotein translocase subunit SecY, partial [Candidatus Bathyarchaeota archaeon]